MTDIKTSLSAFRKIVKKTEGLVFESSGYVVTTLGALTVFAEKRGKKKIYPESLPYTRIGYLAIALSDVKETSFDQLSAMKELISAVPDEDLSDFVTSVMKEFDELKETGLRSEIEIGLGNWMNSETEERIDKALVFLSHIEGHIADEGIIKREPQDQVICTICNKTVDQIYEDARA